jgi:hypothetical protein
MILAPKSMISVTSMDNRKPIAATDRKTGTDMAAIPNLSNAHEVPKTTQMSQVMEKYRGIIRTCFTGKNRLHLLQTGQEI